MTDRALSGLVVVDLTHHVAGPYCTKLLADYGATVVKVERPLNGDGARRSGPFPDDQPHPERSGVFLHLNTNKKGITLNLKTDEGHEVFLDLVQRADVVVENFQPRVMQRLGLDYSALAELKNSLVMTSISNFGQTGPYRDWSATDLIEYAMGGLLYITGSPNREPVKTRGEQAQYVAGLNAFVGTLAALNFAEFTGDGQHVDVSIMESVASILEYTTMMYAHAGMIRKRWYSRHAFGYPIDLLPCKDGYVFVLPGGDWSLFASWCGIPELNDEKWIYPSYRVEHAAELDAILIPWLMERTREDLFHSAQEWRIPFCHAPRLGELLADPQYKAREFFVEVDHPEAGRLLYCGAPTRMSETPCVEKQPAPLLGQHNEEVLGDLLGYSRRRLADLKERDVI